MLPEAGKLQITGVSRPVFLGDTEVWELNQSTLDKLFLNTTKPLSKSEKESLLSDFNGAALIYYEGYNGNLCSQNETEYNIKTTGKIDNLDIEISFKFVALPNVKGNCTFRIFGIMTRYIN